jgi:DNA-binding PadR family transcriptional regulator
VNVAPREEYIPLTPQQLQVLIALAARPLHGYAITQQTARDSSSSVTVGRGTLYGTLRGLLRLNMIEERFDMPPWGPGRPSRWYELTDTGRTVLEWEVERLRMVVHLGYERLGKPKKELESSFFRGFNLN